MPTHQGSTAPVRLPDESPQSARIKVVGVGGGGSNAIDRMIDFGVEGVEFIALNTDIQALEVSKARLRGQIGSRMTNGLSAGSDPDIGRRAAIEDADQIAEALEGADMVFITAGLGGGTGTGAAPVIAAIASEMGALTVAIVTRPFGFEGKRRMATADWGIHHLLNYVDTLIVIPNEKLLALAKDAPFFESFKIADDFLRQAVQGISDIITTAGVINRDFADVKTTMAGMGYAVMGTASRSGPTRAIDAVMAAMESPLLEAGAIDGARGILINITGSSSLRLSEVNDASSVIQSVAHEDANIIFGAVLDERLGDEVKVTVIASGFRNDGRDRSRRQERMLRETHAASLAEPSVAQVSYAIQPSPDPVAMKQVSDNQSAVEEILAVQNHVVPSASNTPHAAEAITRERDAATWAIEQPLVEQPLAGEPMAEAQIVECQRDVEVSGEQLVEDPIIQTQVVGGEAIEDPLFKVQAVRDQPFEERMAIPAIAETTTFQAPETAEPPVSPGPKPLVPVEVSVAEDTLRLEVDSPILVHLQTAPAIHDHVEPHESHEQHTESYELHHEQSIEDESLSFTDAHTIDGSQEEFQGDEEWKDAIRELARLTEMDLEFGTLANDADRELTDTGEIAAIEEMGAENQSQAAVMLPPEVPPVRRDRNLAGAPFPSEPAPVSNLRQAAIKAYASVSRPEPGPEPEPRRSLASSAFAQVLAARRRFAENLGRGNAAKQAQPQPELEAPRPMKEPFIGTQTLSGSDEAPETSITQLPALLDEEFYDEAEIDEAVSVKLSPKAAASSAAFGQPPR